ncbi:MAG: RnfABCDGE type electron transport complex subunit D [Candidatus Shapirobacteria bacterium]|nr:RnfABCDGE type electron transport complex subunit D [Candidatus Shapirobacteria bacterium]
MWSKINQKIDFYLNQITMYRLVLYFLILLLLMATWLAAFGILPYSPLAIILSTAWITLVGLTVNDIFSSVFKVPANVESVYITALILALILSPMKSFNDWWFLGFAAVLAMTSKYILVLGKKHIFNPVAIAVVLTAFAVNQSASWWVGNQWMAPVVLIGGYLITKKIKREYLVGSFLLTATVVAVGLGANLSQLYLHSSLLFLAGVMLTEPLTSPPTRNLQIIFGGLVGWLFVPQVHFGSLYSTPELALIAGNIFSYIVSPKYKLVLKLKDKIEIAPNTLDFVFEKEKGFNFIPGQYMEWTLPGDKSDNRGNRRYFTLASSPTEDNIRLGVKFNNPGSSYKKIMLEMKDETVVASQLAGDFTLPNNSKEKSVFIAGGIGITPFRSMIKYLLDKNDKRDIVLIYANKNKNEAVYQEIFDEAKAKLGIKVIYFSTDSEGHFNKENLKKMVPDYQIRKFYISGTHGLVAATENLLASMSVSEGKIKTDYFPGFA